jgi:hypothetical protein
LQSKRTSYRRVTDTKRLYELMLEQRRRGLPLNTHEIRTPVTKHALDYDGGPPLAVELLRADGSMETVLHAIQEISHYLILSAGQEFPGILLSCPPRPGTQGTRAHLIWPEWHTRMTNETAIVEVIQAALYTRWPDYDWKHIIESPPKLRMLFSDTMDKKTGLMANRPMVMEYVFDTTGQPMDTSTWPETTDMDLLSLCSLRCADDSPLATLLALPARTTPKDTTTSANLDEPRREAVMATFQKALEDIRVKHDKPKAQFYHMATLKISMEHRSLKLGILNHHQCTRETTHKSNNVMLVLYMDRPQWFLSCPKKCPRPAWDDWSRGMIDTSALRAAWPPKAPLPPPDAIPMDITIETPPPSPPREPTISIRVPPEQWDGQYVIVRESEVPTDWSWVSLINDDQAFLLSFALWSNTMHVRRIPTSKMYKCPVRLVPLAHLTSNQS